MFDSFGNFKPVRDYKREDRRLFEQEEEHIEVKLRALEKAKDNTNARHEHEKDLERIGANIFVLTELLRNAEVQLPQRPLKKIYGQI
ncbi:hypothetical protein N7517_005594 [Penicillium concentricum]|uniref:Uncharacterized protein n=1 Tax=Penicillium concentricum TaxID=293559 RepID=A0A9W9SCF6_9EURO|nr:uncharacterized protein N7517_005594 [Penicillium concentricum]KAJ5373588.1 hypothetical protein N7517_005594 [Penicillium concentricum]